MSDDQTKTKPPMTILPPLTTREFQSLKARALVDEYLTLKDERRRAKNMEWLVEQSIISRKMTRWRKEAKALLGWPMNQRPVDGLIVWCLRKDIIEKQDSNPAA